MRITQASWYTTHTHTHTSPAPLAGATVCIRCGPRSRGVWNSDRMPQTPRPTSSQSSYRYASSLSVVSALCANPSQACPCRVQSEEPSEPCGVPPVTKHRLYQDETVPSFFRRYATDTVSCVPSLSLMKWFAPRVRLAFAPDGSLLITPTGVYTAPAASMGPADSLKDTTYVFSRANLNKCVVLGSGRPFLLCM